MADSHLANLDCKAQGVAKSFGKVSHNPLEVAHTWPTSLASGLLSKVTDTLPPSRDGHDGQVITVRWPMTSRVVVLSIGRTAQSQRKFCCLKRR